MDYVWLLGTIKDRNGIHLTEAEDIKKRWQEYTEELYKKDIQTPKFSQTHVHRVSDAIQSSHPLSSPSPPAPNHSQHQSLFQ